MARVLYGPEITALRGSIGGVTFQKNAVSEIARLKPSSRKATSHLQQNMVYLFSYIRQKWNDLADYEKIAWNTYAAAHPFVDYWGITKNISGYNWFMSCNINLYNCSGSFSVFEPDVPPPPSPPAFTLTVSSSDLAVTFSPAYSHSSEYLLVFLSFFTLTLSLKNRKDTRLVFIESFGTTSLIPLIDSFYSTYAVSYPPSAPDGGFYILCQITAIDKEYGISSPFTSAISPFVNV